MWQGLRQRRRQRAKLVFPQSNHALVHGISGQRRSLQMPSLLVVSNDANLDSSQNQSL